ncbi:MAG: peptidylprolyl isomerase [Pisciglobus halotolerans]|nr:peptidylprolyl isomerase [Atopostipes sp.]MDN6626911.1 peptidylprolyl isomerase [Pisciglobus halotolerans]
MKKILFGALASSALLLTACSTSDEVASTESGRIREDDLYEAMKNEQLQNGMTVGQTVLQKMLIEDIFSQTYGDEVSDEDVTEELEDAAEQYGGVDEFEEIIESQGMNLDDYKEDIRLTLLIQEAVKDNADIAEGDVEETYEELKPDATVQHILVEDKELAEDLINELEDGADFGELVEEHSIDPGSLETEGKYSFSEGEMIPEFEEAVFDLEEGETVSEPVESDSGFHVIRRLELEYDPLDEQRDEIESIVTYEYTQDEEFMADLISKLAKEANVQISDEELEGAMAMYMTPEGESEEDEAEEAEESEETESEVEEDEVEENETESEDEAEETEENGNEE